MRKRKEIVPISSSDKIFFEQFYNSNKRFLFYTAKKYTHSHSECEDIVQETIVRLLNNISTLRELSGSKIHKYIVLTVRAAFLDLEKRKHGDLAIFLDDETLEALINAELTSPAHMPNIAAKMEVERLKEKLPSRDWIVLEGKYILGYSQDELGRLIGVAPDSIRMILCRSKERARKILHPSK